MVAFRKDFSLLAKKEEFTKAKRFVDELRVVSDAQFDMAKQDLKRAVGRID